MANDEGIEIDNLKRITPRITPPKEDVFMGLIYMMGVLSRDPITQQCALITDSQDRFVSWAVNYIPKPDFGQHQFKWDEQGRKLAMVSADVAAIDRANKQYMPASQHLSVFSQHVCYVTSPPSLAGIQSAMRNGLRKFIYGKDTPSFFNEQEWEDAQALAKAYKIDLIQFKGNLAWIGDRAMSLSHLF